MRGFPQKETALSGGLRLSKNPPGFSDKRLAVCCAHNLSVCDGQIPHWQPELYFLSRHVRPPEKAVSAYQKSLAEFAARRRQRNKIIFSRDMCVRENTARAASVEFVRHRRTNYARSRPQAFCRKKPEGFSTVSDRPRRRSLFAGIPAPASCKRTPHTPQVSPSL